MLITWDPNYINGATLSNNNLTAQTTDQSRGVRATEGRTGGKWYWEITVDAKGNANLVMGIAPSAYYFNNTATNMLGYRTDGGTANGTGSGAGLASGGVLGIALDADARKVDFYVNGVRQASNTRDFSGYDVIYPFVTQTTRAATMRYTANFGASAFKYAVPEGYEPYQTGIKTKIEDMVIGDMIESVYAFSENTVGAFSQLGNVDKAQYSVLPSSGVAASSGYFYFIYVGDDFKGRKLLIADRNVQNRISWDSLNISGVATKDGIEIKSLGIDPTIWKTNIRLLTGGTASDKTTDSEWNKYIVNGPVGSNNTVWNWNGIASWTSSTDTYGSTYRVVRGSTSNNGFGSVLTNSTIATVGFRPVLVLEQLSPIVINKYLFKDGEEIKVYSDNGWSTIGTAPATKEMFDTYGISDLSLVPFESIALLNTDTPEVLNWTDNIEVLDKRMRVTEIPYAQLVLPIGDINLKNVHIIDEVTVDATVESLGNVRVLLSADSGETWKSFIEGSWQSIDIANLQEISQQGMTPIDFSLVDSADWDDLFAGLDYRRIRFAYFLDVESAEDKAEVYDVKLQFDTKGRWRSMIHGTDFKYRYKNDRLIVELYRDGDFKINY